MAKHARNQSLKDIYDRCHAILTGTIIWMGWDEAAMRYDEDGEEYRRGMRYADLLTSIRDAYAQNISRHFLGGDWKKQKGGAYPSLSNEQYATPVPPEVYRDTAA